MIRWGELFVSVLCAVLIFAAGTGRAGEAEGDDWKKNFAAAPIVISNPNIGSGIGATGMYFFRYR
jgi:hypothetical protein